MTTSMTLDGDWYNELGSMMRLTVTGNQISGTYHTAVGTATGVYELTGRTDTNNSAQSRNVGFVVSWENEHGSSDSVTAWSGQRQVIAGQETITTTWLLTIETGPKANWKSTMVGKDVFTRTPPAADKVTLAQQLRGPSHPLSAAR
jgi:hypothetical protein